MARGLGIPKKAALRECSIALDTISTMVDQPTTDAQAWQALAGIKLLIREVTESLRGNRPLLESEGYVSNLSLMCHDEYQDRSIH